MPRWAYFIFSLTLIAVLSCDQLTPPQPTTTVVKEDNKIFIVDATNKKWDITNAVVKYNFKPEVFAHGLGPNAIRPINNLQMLSPGDPGYSGSANTNRVIGTSLNNDVRAYPLHVLINHEIANEAFGSTHVAVAY